MPTPVEVFETEAHLGRRIAHCVADGIEAAALEGRRFVLGCPGGRTPGSTYRALAGEVARRGLSMDHVIIAMMDDYVDRAPREGWRRVSQLEHHSCEGWGRREIVDPLNAAARTPIDDSGLWLPDPSHAAAYDDRLAAAGGIDVFLLASGESDGHVAFNPPGTPASAGTRVVELAETTRRDNLDTFPGFGDLTEVPTHGVTVGPRTISELSRAVVLLIVGAHKHRAYGRILAAAGYESDWPATVIHAAKNPLIVADRGAATGTVEA